MTAPRIETMRHLQDRLIALEEHAAEQGLPSIFDLEQDGTRIMFADPSSNSALRAETWDNPRIFPCPVCERPNALTARDVQLGYICDHCADAREGRAYPE